MQRSLRIDVTPPALPQLVIDGGASFTNNGVLTLQLSAVENGSGLAAYRLVEQIAAPSEAQWAAAAMRPYLPTDVYSLASTAEGEHTLWARFYDLAGNRSTPVADTVNLLASAPTFWADLRRIDGGTVGAITNQQTLVISSAVTYTTAVEMMVSDGMGSYSGRSWEAWGATKTVLLPAPAGSVPEARSVRAKIRTPLGDEYEILNRNFSLDLAAPAGSLTAAAVTSQASVAVSLTASEIGIVAEVAEDPSFTVGKITVTFPTVNQDTVFVFGSLAEGERTIYYRFVDAAGNASPTAVHSIVIDTTAPQIISAAIVEGGVVVARDLHVAVVALEARDIRVVEGACAGAWQTYNASATVPVSLTSPGDGAKTVSVQLRDAAGNQTACKPLSVALDTTPPAGSVSSSWGSLVNAASVPLTLSASADTVSMRLAHTADFAGSAWEPMAVSTVWSFPPVQGAVSVFVQFRDYAGNSSGTYSLTVTIDTTVPAVASIKAYIPATRLEWEHYAPPGMVTAYTVERWSNGAVASVTLTTEKHLAVGVVDPGYVVRAHWASGITSDPSLAVNTSSFAVTMVSNGFTPGTAEHALLLRSLAAAGFTQPTTPASSCTQGQIYIGVSASSLTTLCPKTPALTFSPWSLAESGFTPPPVTAAVTPQGSGLYAGLALKVSGHVPKGTFGGQAFLSLPPGTAWGTGNPNDTFSGDLAFGERRSGWAVTGRGQVNFRVPLSAVAMHDDVTWATTTPANAFLPTGYSSYEYVYPLAVSYPFAGYNVQTVSIRTGSYFQWPYLHLNPTQPPNYNLSQPGRFMERMVGAEFWNPKERTPGSTYTDLGLNSGYDLSIRADYQAGSVIFDDEYPSPDNDYYVKGLVVSNNDGSRFYRLPVWNARKITLNWRYEYDQPAFAEFLRRTIAALAAPVNVRGGGTPAIFISAPDAVEAQVSASEDFADAVWVPFAGHVTLPEGTTGTWVRVRDEAGNVTGAQWVEVQPAGSAPSLTRVDIAGAGAVAGYSTVRDVLATPVGTFPSDVRIRVSTSPVFADSDWSVLTDGALPMQLPAAAGTYTYWFWLADDANNFSAPVSSTVVFDSTPPFDSQFSVRPKAGGVEVQTRWTVSYQEGTPEVTSATSTALSTLSLPFDFPIRPGVTVNSATIVASTTSGACLTFGSYYSACALERPAATPTKWVQSSPDEVIMQFRFNDVAGNPVTTAVAVYPDGRIKLLYWKTAARQTMRAYVDNVNTPFYDWGYALADGAVEYRRNPEQMRLAVTTSFGEQFEAPWISADGSPWQFFGLQNFGLTTFAGTALSAAGAGGLTSSRTVYLASALPAAPPIRDTPAGHTTVLTGWEFDQAGDARLVQVAQTSTGADTRLRSMAPSRYQHREESVSVYAAPFMRDGAFTARSAGSHLMPQEIARLSSSGAPVVADPDRGLLYGADSAIWSLTNPLRPEPVRSTAGVWSETRGQAARWRNRLWTQSGIWDISTPGSPTYLAANPALSAQQAASRGYVYALRNGVVEVRDAVTGALATSGGSGLTGPLTVVGDRLIVGADTAYQVFNIATPGTLAAFGTTTATATWFTFTNGTFMGASAPIWAMGDLRFLFNNDALSTYLQELASTSYREISRGIYVGDDGFIDAMSQAGYHAGTEGLRTVRMFDAWPGGVQRFSLNTFLGGSVLGVPAATADSRYIYACARTSEKTTIFLFDAHTGDLVDSLDTSLTSCTGLRSAYPRLYVYSGSIYRFRVAGGVISGPEANLGSFYFGGDGYYKSGVYRFYPIPEQGAPLERNCVQIWGDGDRVFCNVGGRLYGTTSTSLQYAGIIDSELTLPMIDLGAGSSAISRDGLVDIGTEYVYVEGLNPATPLMTLSGTLSESGLAMYNSGASTLVYASERDRMNLIARTPFLLLHPGIKGMGVGYDTNDNLLFTPLGYARTERRMGFAAPAVIHDVASAGGWTFAAAGSSGLLRFRAVERLVSDPTSSGAAGGIVRRGNTWTKLDIHGAAIGTATSTPGATLSSFCTSNSSYCRSSQVHSGTPTPLVDHVFEGELGGEIWGIRGYDAWAPGDYVRDLASDPNGYVYAAILTGTVGVHVFGTHRLDVASDHFIATPSGAWGVEVDDGYLFVGYGTSVRSIDTKNWATLSTLSSASYGYTPTHIRAGVGYVAVGNPANGIRLQLPSGTLSPLCSVTGWTDYTVVPRLRSGVIVPLAAIATGTDLQLMWLDSCATIAQFAVSPGGALESVNRLGDAVWASFGTQGGIVSLANLPGPGAITYVNGESHVRTATLTGRFLYTSGSSGTQVFELH